jgi:hypothetical protein
MPGQQRPEELRQLMEEAKEMGLLPELMMQEAISSVALDNGETARTHVVQSARMAVEVTAGLIPEQPEQEYTKRYVVLSDDWYKLTDREKQVKMAETYGQAIGYAQLLINPSRFNWVRVDWIYF